MKGLLSIRFMQWLLVVAISVIAGVLIALYDFFFLKTPTVLEVSASYSFLGELSFSVTAGFVAGILGGAFLVFFIQDRFSDKPYGYTIIALFIIVSGTITLINLPLVALYASTLTGKPVFDPVTLSLFKELFLNRLNPAIFVWVPLVVILQLMLQVLNKFGPGVFWKIVRGKYYTPKVENRVFMFVDLNSSTTIAEKLKMERFHDLLKDFFSDITTPILNSRGEIYQYHGDGIILVWPAYGDVRDHRCVDCFFEMKNEIQSKSEKYLHKFGLVPTFKGGIHSGEVIVGEIGIIKRDITYSGDVMNTAARIQSMCHELKSELLISDEFLRKLKLAPKFTATPVGSISLKGKENRVELSSLSLK